MRKLFFLTALISTLAYAGPDRVLEGQKLKNGNVTWTLPTADGSSGTCLKTNGSETLSFGTCGGGGGGLTNPLTEDLDLGGFSILSAAGVDASGLVVNSTSNNPARIFSSNATPEVFIGNAASATDSFVLTWHGEASPKYADLHLYGVDNLVTLREDNKVGIHGIYYPSADGTAGQAIVTDGAGNLSFATVSGSGSPGGNNTAVQFNDSGSFGGDENTFSWDNSTKRLSIGGTTSSGKLYIQNSLAEDLVPAISMRNGDNPILYGFDVLHRTSVGGDLTFNRVSGGDSFASLKLYRDSAVVEVLGKLQITSEAGYGFDAATASGDLVARVTANDNSFVFGAQDSGDNVFVGSETNVPLYFRVNNSPMAIVNTNGNFGVGTTDPDAALMISRPSSNIQIFRAAAGVSGPTSGSVRIDIYADGTSNIQSLDAANSTEHDLHIQHDGGNLLLKNIRWPTADGTSGQVLQTNGSGVLSFATPSAGSLANNTYLTGRNAADDGDVNIVKVNASDKIQLGTDIVPDSANALNIGEDANQFLTAYIAGIRYDDTGARIQLSTGRLEQGGGPSATKLDWTNSQLKAGVTTTKLDWSGAADTGIRVNSKVQFDQNTPPATTPLAGAGTGATCTLETGSSDSAGRVFITTGTGATNDEWCTITFNTAFSNRAFCTWSARDNNAAGTTLFLGGDNADLIFTITGGATDATSYTYDYICLGQ